MYKAEKRELETPISKRLLDWYDNHARELPWRAPAGQADSYHVLLSEIMLQQTTVAAVMPYFQEFTRRWPDLESFAQAPEEEVMNAWAGLGYYSRARNLVKAAKEIVENHGGVVPGDEKTLLTLPGVGPYTAAAISAIAFDQYSVIMDGNVERVIARYHSVATPLPEAKKELKELAARHTSVGRPGDYAQAIMDLGATICTPKSPKCLICPIRLSCKAHFLSKEEVFPVKPPKKEKPIRGGIAFFARKGEEILLIRRPAKGLLGGMLALPGSDWEVDFDLPTALSSTPFKIDGRLLPGHVDHVFTHFRLRLHVVIGDNIKEPDGSQWVAVQQALKNLPTVMKKAVKHALDAS